VRFAAIWLLWLIGAAGAAQEIVLSGPGEPVQPREYCQILVGGLADADLPGASIEWTPREGTTLLPARLWGGQPFLLFSARTPGKYSIEVRTNQWRRSLDDAVQGAKAAGTVDPAVLDQLAAVAKTLAASHPLRSGSRVVEVAGAPPTPPPPPPPASKVTSALVILDRSSSTEELGLQLNLLRNDKGISWPVEILDPRTEDQNGNQVPKVASAMTYLQGRPLPRLIGVGRDGSAVVDVELPPTAAAIKQTLIDWGMPK